MKSKEEFRSWLTHTKRMKNGGHLNVSTINAYVGTIDNISSDMMRARVIEKSIYYVQSKMELDTMVSKIVNNSGFKEKNSIGHNRHSCALDRFIEFIHQTR